LDELEKVEFLTGGTVMVAMENLVAPATYDLSISEACKPFAEKN
jgi:hypothetical protein